MCDFTTLKVIKVPASTPLYGYKELVWGYTTSGVALCSPIGHTVWTRGRNRAEYPTNDRHSGFHAYRTATFKAGWKIHSICVMVALWGQVAVCKDWEGGGKGYRAEWAKIVRVVGYGSGATKEDCAAAGKEYKVPVGYRKYK